MNSAPPPTLQEQAMIELSRWISRALQYSPQHPLCAQLGARTHQVLLDALREWMPLEVGVLRDKLTIGKTPTRHPVLVTRLAPYLHERGVLILRFLDGVRADELTAVTEVLARPAAEIFAAGGLRGLLSDRRVAHVQVEEIGHELSIEDKEQIRREEHVRELFREMLMRMLSNGTVPPEIGAHIAELADHPDLAVRVIQSEKHVNLAEAVAAFTVILLQEEQRRGEALLEKMGPILMQLAPESRDRVLLGLPPLVGEFRQALASALGVLDDTQLARFALQSVRTRAADLDATFYALSVLATTEERRAGVGRALARLLYDLSLDERATHETLRAIAAPLDETPSVNQERVHLAEAARRILESRAPLHDRHDQGLIDASAFTPAALDRLGRQAAYDVVIRSSRMVDFDKLCAALPAAARSLSSEDHAPAVAGLLLGLAAVSEPRWTDVAKKTLERIARSGISALALRAAERLAGRGDVDDTSIDDVIALARMLVAHNPEPVVDLLERCDSRKLRRALLDVLAAGGPDLLPLVQSRMQSSNWFVTRNMVVLHARLGGPAAELRVLAEHPHVQVRVEIVRALRAMARDPVACDIVVGRLSDAAPDVAQAAIASLATMELTTAAVAALEALAADEARTDDDRRGAVQVLGRSRSDAAPEALARLIQPRGLIERPSTTALRDDVARALRQCPAPGARARFEEALRSSAWRVRKSCERVAGEHG